MAKNAKSGRVNSSLTLEAQAWPSRSLWRSEHPNAKVRTPTGLQDTHSAETKVFPILEEFVLPKSETHQPSRARARTSVLEEFFLFMGWSCVIIVQVPNPEFNHRFTRQSGDALKLAEGQIFGWSAKSGVWVATGLLSPQSQTVRPPVPTWSTISSIRALLG